MDLRLRNSHTEEIRVAAVTDDDGDIILMVGPGDHTCQRFKLTESLARKLRRELNERLD